MPSDKDKLMYWLQKDITDKKCVMEEIIDIYAQIHDLLEKDARQKMKNDDIPFRLNIPINIINILCLKTYDLFSKEPNLLELEAPFHIFGDIHGQYNDLIRFFELVDLPPKNKFLFLTLATTSLRPGS